MHRLRDLDRRQRVVAAVLLVLVAVPFAASAARAVHQQWLPSGDDALIGLRSVDVFSRHLPLVGQPSTSHLYGDQVSTAHPGPIEFFWLAPWVRVFGGPVGMITGSGAVNLASVLVAAWVVLRRAGPAVAGWSLVVLGGVLWAEGTAVLTDPISSNAGAIPLLALAALSWAVADGDVRLLPLAALFGSWVAQQHLAIVAPAAALVLYALVGVAVVAWPRCVGWFRRRGAGREVDEVHEVDDAALGEEADRPQRLWPWLAGAAGVALVCWAPVLWQQATGHPGNITAVVDYAGSSGEAKLGWVSAWRQAARSIGFPPLLVQYDLGGDDFFGGPARPLETLAGVVGYALLVGIVVFQWARRRTLALLALTAIVLAVGGAYNGSTIPEGIEAFRVNFYRWTFVVAWLAWVAYGWMAAVGVRWWLARRGRRAVMPAWAPVAAAAVLLVPAVACVLTAGRDDKRRDQAGFRIMRDAASAAVDEAERADRVTLVLRGQSAILASGPALAMALAERGHDVVATPVESRFYGSHRVLRRGTDPGDLILELVTGRGTVPDGPGRTIMRGDLNPELNGSLAPLLERARGSEVEVSDLGPELLREHWSTPEERRYVAQILAKVRHDPAAVLTDPELLEVVGEGYFTSPRFTGEELAAVRRALPARTVNNDDVFEVRVLNRAELAEEVPTWAR